MNAYQDALERLNTTIAFNTTDIDLIAMVCITFGVPSSTTPNSWMPVVLGGDRIFEHTGILYGPFTPLDKSSNA